MNFKETFYSLVSHYKDFSSSYHKKIDTPNQAPIYIAVSSKKQPAFLFDIGSNYSDNELLHDTAGYHFVKAKKTKDYIRIGIVALSEKSYEVFFIVVEDLISVASDTTNDPSAAIIKRLLMWEEFFKNTEAGVLDKKMQIGLFGELSFLEEALSDCIDSSIISHWKGPDKEVKDFILGDSALEIKTSLVTATNRIKISNENQLDSSGFSNLFLNVRLLEQDQMDGISLPALVESIEKKLEDDPYVTSRFKEKLLLSGYAFPMSSYYKAKYRLSDSLWYKVGDIENLPFPRIIPDYLIKGIKLVQYQIELSTLSTFAVDSKSAKDSLSKGLEK